MRVARLRVGLLSAATAGFGALTICLSATSRGQARGADPQTLQVLADVVLIESRCSQLAVDYGKLFAFAQHNGISPVEIMPTGERRAAFDAAFERRARETSAAQLCGDLAAERAATIPGVFTPR